jgi:hypothetical protein
MCIFLSLCKFIYKLTSKILYISLTVYMVYIDRYIPIYMFKYVYMHIQVRQQLEYKLKSKKRETRPFSLDWYYQPRLKGWAQVLACPPPLSLCS